jgi:hypothetical protein
MSGWENYLESDEVRNLLWAAKELLGNAWKADLKLPKSYPFSTSYALGQIREKLRGKKGKPTRFRFFPQTKRVKRLSDLLPGKTVRAIWEEYHAEDFDEVLRKAASIGSRTVSAKEGWKAFKAIERAMETTYLVTCYGDDFLSKPKNSILHRGLDKIARLAGLHQTTVGFAEFLDDICPCGLKNHSEALRKMESRTPRMRRPKG